MSFEPAGNYLFQAANKYKLVNHALGSTMCEKSRKIIQKYFPKFAEDWKPKKFTDHTLTIQAQNAASSSELFLYTEDLKELINKENIPQKIDAIKIVRA